MQKPKISSETKEQIIADFESGVSKYRIAKNYGISRTAVHYIINPEKVAENRKNTVKNNLKNNLRVRACRERKKNKNNSLKLKI
jgi:DNA invertase Pin-like site-specific DNA recombinase